MRAPTTQSYGRGGQIARMMRQASGQPGFEAERRGFIDAIFRDVQVQHLISGGLPTGTDGQLRIKRVIGLNDYVVWQLLASGHLFGFNPAATEEAKFHVNVAGTASSLELGANDGVIYITLDALDKFVQLGDRAAAPDTLGQINRNGNDLYYFDGTNVIKLNASLGGAAPSGADFLVGTANGGLSAEIVVGTTPGGELGGTWGSPTVDATHSGTSHAGVIATHEGLADPHTVYRLESADHSHESTGLQGGQIDEDALALTDVTTNNLSATKHGFAPKTPNDATKYLDGTGAFSTPAGSSTLVHIASTTISNVATVDFTGFNSSLYVDYLFIFENVVPATDTKVLWMRTSTDGGVSYDAGAANYDTDSAVAAAQMVISPAVKNEANPGGLSGFLTIHKPDAAINTKCTWHMVVASDTATIGLRTGAGARLSAADVNAVRFMFDSGNLTSGQIRMYGIKAS